MVSAHCCPLTSVPTAYIFNTSLCFSVVPDQWKSSSITPVPKDHVTTHLPGLQANFSYSCAFRLFEKEFVRQIIYPVLVHPTTLSSSQTSLPLGLQAQPLGRYSALTHSHRHAPNWTYVHVIALDFSKAFDTVRHQTLLAKFSDLPIPDCTYNWLLEYFSKRCHLY